MTSSTELDLRVEGMTCVACTRRVQKALERVEGVASVEVDLVRERARVRGTSVDAQALTLAAEQAGYKLVAPAETKALASPKRSLPAWSVPVAALFLAAVLTALPFAVPPSVARSSVELGLAALVCFGLGGPLFRRAWDELRARSLGMNFLVTTGALASLGLHGLMMFEAASHAAHGMSHAEGMAHSDAASAATIIAFTLLGRWLEARARHRVAEALDALETPLDASARVVRHGSEGDVKTTELRAGDVVIIPPHGVLPADGTVLPHEGPSPLIDEAWLTGESLPVERGPGAAVHAGTVNTARPFRMTVKALGKDTRRAQIAAMVSGALTQKSPLVIEAERWSARVVPIVLLVTGATFAVLLGVGAEPTLALTRAVTVLVVACPCALGLATPTAIAAAMGSALRAGILVSNPGQLELLAGARIFVFDKTGTLTEGHPRPIAIHAAEGETDALLRLAAAVETESEHPLGRAIFEEAMRRKLVLPVATDLSPLSAPTGRGARGVRGSIEGKVIEVAAMPPVDEPGETEEQEIEDHRRAGASIVRVTEDGRELGWMAIADALRPEARGTVQALRARGIDVRLLSGDHPLAARARGLEVGLSQEHIEGGLSPDDKRRRLAELGQSGPVVMVGDGINDAPALAAAAVGIAIGKGARIAMETAGITIEHGLTLLLPALDLAQRTHQIIRQNLLMAFAYNVVALPMAALGALDAIGGPSVAALAMACSSIAVVLSSLRLTRKIAVPRLPMA